MKFPNLPQFDVSKMTRHEMVVFGGALALMTGAAILRLGLRGFDIVTLVTTLGLFVVDVGAALKVHSIGKRRHEHNAQRRDAERRTKTFTVADRQHAVAVEAQRVNDQALADAEDRLELRKILAFDVEEKRRWAAAMTLAGYRAGINSNRGALRPERG